MSVAPRSNANKRGNSSNNQWQYPAPRLTATIAVEPRTGSGSRIFSKPNSQCRSNGFPKSSDTSRAIESPSADNTAPAPKIRPAGKLARNRARPSATARVRKYAVTSGVACAGNAYSVRSADSNRSIVPPSRATISASRTQRAGGFT